jgi:DNA-binding response OmpR family regulator
MRILLAEDSMELQSAVRRLLRAVGATIECANDGREATSMANTHRYDAILMDLVMPHVSGIQATQALRSNGQDMPIIAFTGDATAEVYQAARDAGCDEVLSKPFDASHLIATIRTLVARQRSQTADTER